MPYITKRMPPDLAKLCCLLNWKDGTGSPLDWSGHQAIDKAVELAHAHNTLAIILPKLTGTPLSVAVGDRLATSQSLLTAQGLFLEHELKTVMNILAAVGIEAVALKGAFLASCVYPDFAARPMNDFDLLVPKNTLKEATAALERAGYTCIDGGPDRVPPGGSLEFQSRHGHAVELRYELTQGTRLRGVFNFGEEQMWGRRRKYVAHSGMDLLSLSPMDHLLYLVYHAGILHLFTALIWLVDLDRFVRAFEREIVWNELAAQARKSGCGTCLWYGLTLAHELLDTPVDLSVLRALRPGRLRAALIRYWLSPQKALRGMLPPAEPQMQALQMLLVDSVQADIRCFWQGLFPPREWLSWRYQTSNGVSLAFLRALYPLGGWALARK